MGLFKKKKEKVVESGIDFNKVSDAFIAANDDEELLEKLNVIVDGNQETAENLSWFFPVILFRLSYPQIRIANRKKYYVLTHNGYITCKFSDSPVYKELEKFLEEKHLHWDKNIKIKMLLVHGADLDAVNKALNAGSRMSDLILSCPVYVSRLK